MDGGDTSPRSSDPALTCALRTRPGRDDRLTGAVEDGGGTRDGHPRCPSSTGCSDPSRADSSHTGPSGRTDSGTSNRGTTTTAPFKSRRRRRLQAACAELPSSTGAVSVRPWVHPLLKEEDVQERR